MTLIRKGTVSRFGLFHEIAGIADIARDRKIKSSPGNAENSRPKSLPIGVIG
jgi:hypothetical protein